jgi:glycerate dehydrogenase
MTTKITVLDGYTLNPGDLSWSEIENLGEMTVYEHTPDDLIPERSKGSEILFTNKTPLKRETLEKLDGLKYIGVLATGYNVVDVEAAKDMGIIVTNIPTYGTYSVAQMVFAHILELCQNVALHSSEVKKGEWTKSRDFCFWKSPLVELYSKNMGIIGFGRIGKQVAAIADAMGMNIIASEKYKGEILDFKSFKWAETDELLKESDIVSLHCPLFPDTEGIINKDSLALMKPSAFLINTSRGGLVVDRDLADALNNGIIAGAGLDVVSTEPPSKVNPLLGAKNCNITPHIAWATKEARARLMHIAAENLKAFLSGKPVNTI